MAAPESEVPLSRGRLVSFGVARLCDERVLEEITLTNDKRLQEESMKKVSEEVPF